MVFSKEQLILTGSCNCRAVRYRIKVPGFDERPPNPYRTPGSDIEDLRIPFVAICHCNDRRASANISPHVLVTKIKDVDATPIPASERNLSDSERTFETAELLFNHADTKIRANTNLAVYKSSPQRSRWFCRNCGTPLGYSVDDGVIPDEWKWPKMLDLWLGTLDRECLEQENMKPERQLWCHYGIPWIKDLADHGSGTPCHPLTKIDKVLGRDNVEEDLKELEALK